MGSVKRIRAASVEELSEVPGIGPVLAEAVVQHLQTSSDTSEQVANVSTGEIVAQVGEPDDGER